jgi:hypothetical protein
LSHFADQVVFTSPLARQLLTGSDGVLLGKTALHDYWAEGLRRNPHLRFELVDVYVGVHTVVINYRNQRGGLFNEVLIFDGSLVVQGHGTYQDRGQQPVENRVQLTEPTPAGRWSGHFRPGDRNQARRHQEPSAGGGAPSTVARAIGTRGSGTEQRCGRGRG